ncbi:inorganic diphosphatase [Hymenobacter sp. BT175]|uniref:inorganic diphosphatase n=1 Tax=Hymenobacter translucens TaxID=2886507 RepID=UPI001D0E7E19|nr:inorganic diphosphatase [Hymenobacter translucens]MCC2546934.1 inorganic diphosphatase [Hymenobacter translucens]
MRIPVVVLTAGLLSAALPACKPKLTELPTFSTERKLLQMVVEIPAGTNHEQLYDPATGEFRRVQRAGTDRQVEFLPFPGNYGFVPGTHSAAVPSRPLPILLLAETQPAGTVVEVLPVGLLLLDNAGMLEQVVLAVPARPSQRILPDITTWAELLKQYPSVKESLRIWFQHRGNDGEVRVMGWKDEKAAEQQVRVAMQ